MDHALYHPTDRATSERAYVALSRGRHSNRIYAVTNAGWQEALNTTRAHTIAADQQPTALHDLHQCRARSQICEPLNQDRDLAATRHERGRSTGM
ncbi:MAG: hypothetical protein ACRDZO_15715 [Egibacteraceae bacterium]